jgi:hypothetical protein
MPKNLTAVCVRLEPQTLRLLDGLQHTTVHLPLLDTPLSRTRPFNRSELIRHAITAGLDVLTSDPKPEPREPSSC